MTEYSVDLLQYQDQEAAKNTYYRSPKVSPSWEKREDCMIIRTAQLQVEIRYLQEVILGILASFKFIPFWLIDKWYKSEDKHYAKEEIINWIGIGLVWVEPHPTGIYLRPTKFLLDLFQQEQTRYQQIPFNTLTHTLSEMEVMFQIQMGSEYSELWQIIKQEENRLPKYHKLDIKDEDEYKGTIVIREGDFRANMMKRSDAELLEQEAIIKEQIQQQQRFTLEFEDFNAWPIITSFDGVLTQQIPDLVVPIFREYGLARSYAIEIELTIKKYEDYVDIMTSYKNNNKFGKLFYLVGTAQIGDSVRQAFNEVGGLGSCELYVVPFTPPTLELGNFTYEDEQKQLDLIAKQEG
jgi:hypothetical protein